MRKIITVLLCVVILSAFQSCTLTNFLFNKDYSGGKEDLYTVAAANVFGARGYRSNGEVSYSPFIYIMEKDAYGRTLFFYSEHYFRDVDEPTAFIIMQKSDDNRVYYYQDDCVMPYVLSDDEIEANYHTHKVDDWCKYIADNAVSTGVFNDFKRKNDWGEETDLSKCTSTKTVRRINLGDDDKFDNVIYDYVKKNGSIGGDYCVKKPSTYQQFCNSDKNGLELYKVVAWLSNTDEQGKSVTNYHLFAVIYDPAADKASVAELTDVVSCYGQISQLKENSGWVKPETVEIR